jgi:regulator of RNase E activity RraB
MITKKLDALFCGRITTEGRREFYYYASRSDRLDAFVQEALEQFRGYEFECGSKADPKWTQYLDVLYPSEEDRQRIENRKVLDVIEEKGDTLNAPRDVWHWIYFRTNEDRDRFLGAVASLEYRLQSKQDRNDNEYPKGACIVRFQSVKPDDIDDAVAQLHRLAKTHRGDYDGWETQVNPG